jgi:hypothetical protein
MKIMEDGTVVFEDAQEESDNAPDGRVAWEVAACHYYVNVGNIAATARRFNTTVYEIKKLMGTTWWQEESGRIRADSRVKIDAGFTRIVEKGIALLEERLDNGDISRIKEMPDGRKIITRTAVKAVDIAKITDMAFMKRQLVRNEPTVVAGDTQALSMLAQKLRALGRKDPTLLDAPVHVEDMGKKVSDHE